MLCRAKPLPQHLAAFTWCLVLQCLRELPQQCTRHWYVLIVCFFLDFGIFHVISSLVFFFSFFTIIAFALYFTVFSPLPFCDVFITRFSHLPISPSGKYSEYKPSWPPEPIGQNKLWKTNRNSSQLPRPPPGLTNQKQASPSPWGSGPRLARSWGGGGMNQESRFGPGAVTGKILYYFITICQLMT